MQIRVTDGPDLKREETVFLVSLTEGLVFVEPDDGGIALFDYDPVKNEFCIYPESPYFIRFIV